jgi:thiamine-phosphate pyrophosphorylase
MADDSPSLYLFTPVIERVEAFEPMLQRALDAAQPACVFLRLATMGDSEASRIASRLTPIVQAAGAAALLANPRVAARAGADGVHLAASGDEGLARLSEAIESLKPERIVGAGGLRSRHDAMSAGELDIDYVAFGDPAPDGWTAEADFVVERVEWWASIFNVPCVGFAAQLADVERIGSAGADFVAIGDAVWSDPRGVEAALRDASAALARVVRPAGP